MELVKSTSNHWDTFWIKVEKGGNLERRKICFDRAQFILSQDCIRNKVNPVIYDMGCGYAEVSKYLMMEIPTAQLVATDWSDGAVEIAARNLFAFTHRSQFIQADCCNDDRYFESHKEKADIILSLGVIEHFISPKEILNKMTQILKPGGIIVLMVPNRFSSAPLTRKIKEFRKLWKFGYQREYSTSELAQWSEESNLKVLSKMVVQRNFSPQDDKILAFFSWVDRQIAKIFKNWGFYSYVFIQKKEINL